MLYNQQKWNLLKWPIKERLDQKDTNHESKGNTHLVRYELDNSFPCITLAEDIFLYGMKPISMNPNSYIK